MKMKQFSSMRFSLARLSVAAALAIGTTAAWADDYAVTLAPTGSGTFAATFFAAHAESGLIVDNFVFSLPAAFGDLLGNGVLTFDSSTGPVSLVVAALDAGNGVGVASDPGADSIAIPTTLSFSGAASPLSLAVLGFAGDPFGDVAPLTTSYGGRVMFTAAVAAVPEPQTYALMLAGLVGIGCAARRRRHRRSAAASVA